MNAESTTQLVLAILCFSLLAGAAGWTASGRHIWPPVALTAVAAAALVAALADDLSAGRTASVLLVVVCGLLAVVAGGPLVAWVFAFVDRDQPATESVVAAQTVLRGGAWIGALERLAVFAGLAAGFPEGVAVVLALKGVGRYPDLRNDSGGGSATERFIIGTFTSVLWAAACAGMVTLVLR